MQGRKTSNETINTIRSMYNDGYSVREISQIMGKHWTCIYTILEKTKPQAKPSLQESVASLIDELPNRPSEKDYIALARIIQERKLTRFDKINYMSVREAARKARSLRK